MADHLEDAARIFLYDTWRESLKATGNYDAVQEGVDLPPTDVHGLTEYLRRGLAGFLAQPELDAATLTRRSRSRSDIIPLALIERPSAASRRAATPPIGGAV